MKTKEVIRLLQECDPSGEEEVLVGNRDIFDIHMEPSYYDGCAQIMIRDPDCEYYNIIGAKWTAKGHKIVISGIGIEDVIWNNPDVPVEVDGGSYERLSQKVEEWRQEARKFIAEADVRAKIRAEKEKGS